MLIQDAKTIYTYHLRCARCRANSDEAETPERAREAARTCGWGTGDADLCPDCAAKTFVDMAARKKEDRTMTHEEAVAFCDSRKWESMTDVDIFTFQINQPRLCMPFSVFHKAANVALGRPVFTHEFADPEGLRKEFAAKLATRIGQ